MNDTRVHGSQYRIMRNDVCLVLHICCAHVILIVIQRETVANMVGGNMKGHYENNCPGHERGGNNAMQTPNVVTTSLSNTMKL